MDRNDLFIAMIPKSGHSWWQARYADGKVLSEWDTITHPVAFIINGRASRWEEVPKRGMVGLRLLCPNGLLGGLEAPEGRRFFQLKVGSMNIIAGLGSVASREKRTVAAHIIGVVENAEGDCLCRAWEYPVVETVTWRRCWKCGEMVKTEFCHCGQDLRGIAPVDRVRMQEKNVRTVARPGRLIEFRDNIFHMKYRNLGRLNFDVQQVKV